MTRTRSTLRTLAVLIAMGIAYLATNTSPGADTQSAGEPFDPVEALGQLRIAPETDNITYDREAFGGWDTDYAGCTTRERVLIEESRTPPSIGEDCEIVEGDWVSPYDGVPAHDPVVLEIDHLVALAEAWESGADSWSPDQRRAFANDVANPDALIAVTTETNQAKSDRDPAEWLPPAETGRCRYALAWIHQKLTWGLTVDVDEHLALATVISTSCSQALAGEIPRW